MLVTEEELTIVSHNKRVPYWLKWGAVALAISILGGLLLALTRDVHSQETGESFTCVVAKISDGDTWRCKDGRRVRGSGFNARERAIFGKPGEPGAEAATEFLGELLSERAGSIWVGYVSLTCELVDTDRHGRSVARCTTPDGRDVGAEMVAAGHASACPRYGGERYVQYEAEGTQRVGWCG